MSYWHIHGKGDKSTQTLLSLTGKQAVITNFSIESELIDANNYNHKVYIKYNNGDRKTILNPSTTYTEKRKYLDAIKGTVIPEGAKLEIEVDYDDQLALNQPQNIVFSCSVYSDDGNPTGGGEVIAPYLVGQNSALGDSCTTGTRLIVFSYYGGNATVTVDTSAWTTNKDNTNMSIVRWTNAGLTTFETIATIPQSTGGEFSMNIGNLQPFYGLSLKGFANGVSSELCCQWDQKSRKIIVNDGQISSVVS